MTFVPITGLRAGMMLERDVYGYGSGVNDILVLKCGEVLTQPYIDKLYKLDISGVYIHSDDKGTSMETQPPINQQLTQETISSIEQIYKIFDQTARDVNRSSINQTTEVSKKLVDALMKNEDVKFSIANLKLYDDCTYNHSLGVSVLSIAIGLSLGLDKNDLYELGLCALLHDIGKMAVPIEIISKPGKLTPEEFDIVKQHPAKGAEFLYSHNLANRRICAGVLSHHEKYDGSGYPNGLSGKRIPLFGRIISIADVYDALTSERPYRKPSSPSEAIEYIMGCGNAFDISLVKAFLKKVSPYPIGSCVKLSNEQIAVVVKQNEFHPLRPVIRMLNRPNVALDLAKRRDLQNVVIVNLCNMAASGI
jgi:uncharacterized domain HDIG